MQTAIIVAIDIVWLAIDMQQSTAPNLLPLLEVELNSLIPPPE
jgi:hypothetical protein